MNENGHPQTLQPFTPGNAAALRHGLYSGRALSERAAEIRDALQEAPWAQALDVIAAEEIGSVVAALETIDAELQARPKAAARRMLLEHKGRLTRELRAWLREAGATPKARADFARALASPTVAEEIARRRAALNGGDEGMSEAQDERAVLQTIAYGEKAAFAERLKALEMLRTLDRGAEARDFYADLVEVPEIEVDRHLDARLVADVIRSVLIGEPLRLRRCGRWHKAQGTGRSPCDGSRANESRASKPRLAR